MKIFLDYGHNSLYYDTGACGNGLKEQDITFEIGEKLKNKLKYVGFDVKSSRVSKGDIIGNSLNSSLSTRAKMANDWKADLFISIHCNSFALSSANGTEIYVFNKKSKVLGLAENIVNSIANKLALTNRGVKTSNFAVLKKTSMPAMLVETAFISNINDAQKLKDRQDEFAEAIFTEICKYYKVDTKKVEEIMPIVSEKPECAKYHIEGTTHIVEIDPRNIWAVETQCATNKVKYNNFVNSIFFMNLKSGKTHPQGIMVNAGKVIANYCTHGEPVATLIIHGKDDVEMKYVTDITKEKNVWFAVSGYGVYPKDTHLSEGFIGAFSDVARATNRPIIGYRKKDNKIVIAVRSGSNAERAGLTAKNLGLDFAISLDGGGSTTLKVNGNYKFKGDGRKIFGGLIWS